MLSVFSLSSLSVTTISISEGMWFSVLTSFQVLGSDPWPCFGSRSKFILLGYTWVKCESSWLKVQTHFVRLEIQALLVG